MNMKWCPECGAPLETRRTDFVGQEGGRLVRVECYGIRYQVCAPVVFLAEAVSMLRKAHDEIEFAT